MRWSCKFKLQLNWVDPLGQKSLSPLDKVVILRRN